MLCPHCSIAEVSETTHQCPLCGYTPSAGVMVEPNVSEQIQESVQRGLADRYRITAVLRLGQRSYVYLASDLATEQLVNLHAIPIPAGSDPELPARFQYQASVAAKLRHAHIVPILAYGATSTFLWYVTDHVRGRALTDVLRDRGRMDLDTCVRLIGQVAAALDFAHRAGVVHGDVKPTNIVIDEEGWGRVSGFAVLHAFDRRHASAPDARVMHDPEYMAPEQFFARATGPAADQYSLGVVVYQCLAGSVPFVGDSFEELARRQTTEPPPRLSSVRPDLPVPTMEAVQRALAKTPAGRFPTILDFATALSGEGRASVPVQASTPSSPQVGISHVLLIDDDRPWYRRRWPQFAAAALVLGCAATLMLQPSWLAAARRLTVQLRHAIGGQPGPGYAAQSGLQWDTLPSPAADATPSAATSDSAMATTPAAPAVRPSLPQPRQPRPQPAAPAEPAHLFVQSRPWGEVFVDGVSVGNTPKMDIPIVPGRHIIRVVREGFIPFEGVVNFGAGQVIRLTQIVLDPEQQ